MIIGKMNMRRVLCCFCLFLMIGCTDVPTDNSDVNAEEVDMNETALHFEKYKEVTFDVSDIWGEPQRSGYSYESQIVDETTILHQLLISMDFNRDINDPESAAQYIASYINKSLNTIEILEGYYSFLIVDGHLALYSERKPNIFKKMYRILIPIENNVFSIGLYIDTDADMTRSIELKKDFLAMVSTIKINDPYRIQFRNDYVTKEFLGEYISDSNYVDFLVENKWTPLKTLIYGGGTPFNYANLQKPEDTSNSDNNELEEFDEQESDNTSDTAMTEMEEIVEQKPESVPASENVEPKEQISTDKAPAASYTTNTKETYKNGNSGVYSYVNKGAEYSIYLIIDLDEGYVYYFTEGNGNEVCDKVKITEGDLNSTLIITYRDGDDVWKEAMYFKHKNQPDQLVYQDSGYYSLNFKPTNLNEAIKLRNKKRIRDN